MLDDNPQYEQQSNAGGQIGLASRLRSLIGPAPEQTPGSSRQPHKWLRLEELLQQVEDNEDELKKARVGRDKLVNAIEHVATLEGSVKLVNQQAQNAMAEVRRLRLELSPKAMKAPESEDSAEGTDLKGE